MITDKEQARLERLGFERDKGGFWQRGDDLHRITIGEASTLSDDGGWLLIADRSDEVEDPERKWVQMEILRLRFETLLPILDALQSGQRSACSQCGEMVGCPHDARRFSMQVEGDQPTSLDIAEFIEANAESLTIVDIEAINSLNVGDAINYGGGAAPLFTLKRES